MTLVGTEHFRQTAPQAPLREREPEADVEAFGPEIELSAVALTPKGARYHARAESLLRRW